MKIKLTKRQVIRALETEPLRSGAYVHLEQNEGEYDMNGKFIKTVYKNNTECAVCAVGSLMDCSIGTKKTPRQINRIAERLTTFPHMRDSDDMYVDLRGTGVRGVIAYARARARNGQYLSALSGLFEALADRKGYTTLDGLAGYRLRNILIQFVKSEFPTKLVLNTEKKY